MTVKSAAPRTGRRQYGGAATPVVALTANFENTGVDRHRFDGDTVGDRPAGAYTLKMAGEARGSTGRRCPVDVSAETRFTIA